MKKNLNAYQKPKIRKESIKVRFFLSPDRPFDSLNPDINSQVLLAHGSSYCSGVCAYCW